MCWIFRLICVPWGIRQRKTGNDIKEKKLTLPLIYTLNNIDKSTRRKIIYIVKNNNRDKKKVLRQ